MVNKFKLHVADFDILSDARTLEILNNGATATSNFKVVKVGDADIGLTGFPTITFGDLPIVQTQQFETKCAAHLQSNHSRPSLQRLRTCQVLAQAACESHAR